MLKTRQTTRIISATAVAAMLVSSTPAFLSTTAGALINSATVLASCTVVCTNDSAYKLAWMPAAAPPRAN